MKNEEMKGTYTYIWTPILSRSFGWWHSFLTIFKCLLLKSCYTFLIVIRIIKNGKILYKDNLFQNLGTASDVTKKGTANTTFFKEKPRAHLQQD